jgi:hypothetical protein
VAVTGVVEDSRVSEFECNFGRPAVSIGGVQPGFSPFKRTQVDVLHPKFHCNPGQRQSEMTDPSEDMDVRILAFDICGANTASFDPRSIRYF